MDLIRISDKMISQRKIETVIKDILLLRSQGYSQQEVADKLRVDRTFISRLEKMGQLRKGNSIAVVGFPIENKEEVAQLLDEQGVDYHLLLTEEERWDFVKSRSGVQLLNELTAIMAKLKSFDTLLIIGSNERIMIFEAIYPQQVVGLAIGQSPIEKDILIDLEELNQLLVGIQAGGCCSR